MTSKRDAHRKEIQPKNLQRSHSNDDLVIK